MPNLPPSTRRAFTAAAVAVACAAVLPWERQHPGTPAADESPSRATPTRTARAMTPSVPDRAELTRRLDDYLRGREGELSLSVRDRTSGFGYTYHPGLRVATASIVKADIAAALLLTTHRRHFGLTAAEKRLMASMITHSDNDAANTLWGEIGTGAGLAAANKRLGLRETEPGSGFHWGTTTSSAADQVRLLQALTSDDGPMHAVDQRYLLGLMARVEADQAWGVSAGAGTGDAVALKNGWLPRSAEGGRWVVNSIGRIDGPHDLLLAVVSHRHPSMAAGVTTVERACELVTGAIRG